VPRLVFGRGDGDNEGAEQGAGRKAPEEPSEIEAWRSYKSCEPRQESQRFEHQLADAIPEGALELEDDLAVFAEVHTLRWHGRAGEVTDEALQTFFVEGIYNHLSVDLEAAVASLEGCAS